ncbi:MAG: chorismate-binding protein [Paracoccaceae bacterium]|nr:chorismate-binding protein [Paracoccaceae bacterium]
MADSKNRVENLKIFELLRNDLSRVCLPGSVTVPELFTVQNYTTLHQMTSLIDD